MLFKWIRSSLIALMLYVLASCNHESVSLTSKEFLEIKRNVSLTADSISKNVSDKGPAAWLQYFERTPQFFMASEGQLAFPNNEAAKTFIINNLVKSIRKIELHWSNIHIDPLTDKFANMAANFHEEIVDSSGKISAMNGYFTAVMHRTAQGWKLHNMHWSIGQY